MNQLIAFVQISRLLDGLFKHNDHTLLLRAKYIGWLLQEIWVTLLLPWQYEPQNGVSIGVALISSALVVSAAGSGSPFLQWSLRESKKCTGSLRVHFAQLML